MIRTRLYMQIYLTIILSLVLVVVMTALALSVGGRDQSDLRLWEKAGQLALNALPEAELSIDLQAERFDALLDNISLNASLYDADGELIASKGQTLMLPTKRRYDAGWQRLDGRMSGWFIQLPDGRWLIAASEVERNVRDSVFNVLLVISAVALAIAFASYPFVRRLTRRLETLKDGVDQIGSGDLAARVSVEGRDEIAAVASSFNHAAEQIEKLLSAHKTLLANASHELRTPLSRMRLGLELYQQSGNTQRLNDLRTDIDELDGLIEEILLMSRLDNTNMQITLEECDLNALIEAEMAHFEDVFLSGTAPIIYANKTLIQRVIRNLINNAFKHGAPPVEITISQEQDQVILSVSDHGPGVSEADQAKIFERFYRGADRQNVEGYGLGLPLVQQIIEAHKGSITLANHASTGEPGFTITISLPV